MTQTPSVGRIVHYVSHGTPVRPDGSQAYVSDCRAAIITEVTAGHPHDEHGPRVALAVLNPTGLFFQRSTAYDETGQQGGTWHWPERV